MELFWNFQLTTWTISYKLNSQAIKQCSKFCEKYIADFIRFFFILAHHKWIRMWIRKLQLVTKQFLCGKMFPWPSFECRYFRLNSVRFVSACIFTLPAARRHLPAIGISQILTSLKVCCQTLAHEHILMMWFLSCMATKMFVSSEPKSFPFTHIQTAWMSVHSNKNWCQKLPKIDGRKASKPGHERVAE